VFARDTLTFLLNFFPCPGEKENSLKTDDYGRDLSSVQTLLTKQVSANAASTHKWWENRWSLPQCTRIWYLCL